MPTYVFSVLTPSLLQLIHDCTKINFSIVQIWKQQEEVTRWWPLYLEDQECVGKIQLCLNLSMPSDNYGSAKVCSFILLLIMSVQTLNIYLNLNGIVKIDAARWSGCRYNYIWHGSGSSNESSKFQQQNVAHQWFVEMAVGWIFWLLWGIRRI